MGKRMEWAATFASVVTARDEPRTDCPSTLPALPARSEAEAAAAYAAQRAKPLNHHMEAQLLFYCTVNNEAPQVLKWIPVFAFQ